MKAPPVTIPRRPAGATRRPPRTRTEAAVELVRLEFDAARLQRELDQSERRATRAREQLATCEARAAALIGHLDGAAVKASR